MLQCEIVGRFLTPNDRNDRLNHYANFSTPLGLNRQSKHNADFSDNPIKAKP